MKEKEIRKKILELAKRMRNKEIHVLLSDEKQYNQVNDMLLTILVKEKKFKCIYVSLNKGYKVLSKKMQSLGIDNSNIYFIDAISKTVGKPVTAVNCTFLSSSHLLTELSLAITAAINTGKFDFLFFDSLSTLLIYNEMKTAEKFSQYIINKIRENDLGSILISLKNDKEAQKLMPILTLFCDGCIDLSTMVPAEKFK